MLWDQCGHCHGVRGQPQAGWDVVWSLGGSGLVSPAVCELCPALLPSGRYESVIATLCENLDSLDEPEARAAMIWIVGEYAERIDNADELLESFLEGFHDESTQVCPWDRAPGCSRARFALKGLLGQVWVEDVQ